MGLFDFAAFPATAPQLTAGNGLTAPAATPGMPTLSLLPAGGAAGALAAPATAATGANPMALISMMGMLAGAIGGPNSASGRIGQGVQQQANGSMMAQAMLAREQGQRDFLSKILKAHGDSKSATDSLLGLTPKDTGGVSGSMGGGI